jgi:hypothetical protein
MSEACPIIQLCEVVVVLIGVNVITDFTLTWMTMIKPVMVLVVEVVVVVVVVVVFVVALVVLVVDVVVVLIFILPKPLQINISVVGRS